MRDETIRKLQLQLDDARAVGDHWKARAEQLISSLEREEQSHRREVENLRRELYKAKDKLATLGLGAL